MQTVGEQRLWGLQQKGGQRQTTSCTAVRKSRGVLVRSYLDLVTKVAELQFLNRDLVLLFRGQNRDFKNQARNSSLKPSMFRADRGNPSPDELRSRFSRLEAAEEALQRAYEESGLAGGERLQRERILRWAILQHYEICRTPLLDVTHSLRIAASFASHGAQGEAFLFVLGVPHLSGAITVSADAGVQIVRLSSACPPSAIRPHIQEGYLLGEYPEMVNYDQKKRYEHYEIDFGQRLVAKFRFEPRAFWKDRSFPAIGQAALYPAYSNDPLAKLARALKSRP